MKKTIGIPLLILSVLIQSCNGDKKENQMTKDLANNPLLKTSTLEYLTPDFSIIHAAHFEPAFTEAMKIQKKTIEDICADKNPANFDNTILALEKSNALLDQISNVFYSLTGAHTNDTLDGIQERLAPIMSAHRDEIYLNSELFKRIKIVNSQKDNVKLDAESVRLVTYYYDDFVIQGANLSDSDKSKVKEINGKLATLSNKFNKSILDAGLASAVIVKDVKELDGLSKDEIEGIKEKDGTYKISIVNTTQQPILQSLKNRDLRKRVMEASIHRADGAKNNTESTIIEIATLRAEKAKLLGYNNYAAWSMQNSMAKTPENVWNLFNSLIPATTAKAAVEAKEIQQLIDKEGQKFQLEAADWNLYAEKVRKEKYDLEESQIKPYFEMVNTLEKGVFFAAQKLYGITYTKRTDLPTYHPDVLVYELFEEDGSKLGLFYADFYARPSKRGGAWMSNFVTQSHLHKQKPVIYNVMNIVKPAAGAPTLLSYDEAETMFHEFGHALHGFFADQHYPSLSGTAVARDFVEFPSQFNENWALYPSILKNYAIHYKTGKPMPTELVDKIKKASTFNQGFMLTEFLAAANLDMKWHSINMETKIKDATAFEKNALRETKLDVVSSILPRYRSTFFAHIFGGGYGAGYYAYLWTEMLHHDAFNWFEENGGLTRANGQRFRDMVLSRGNTLDYDQMYESWRGGKAKFEPLLKARGLK
jgi:peptidyl-dipeptidase Dcp